MKMTVILMTVSLLTFCTKSLVHSVPLDIEAGLFNKYFKDMSNFQNFKESDSLNDKIKDLIVKDDSLYTDITVSNFEDNNLFACGVSEKCKNILGGLKNFNLETATKSSGLMIQSCNEKIYFMPKENVFYQDSWKHCCQWGMSPATFESQQELTCIYEAYSKLTGHTTAENPVFYTAIMDANLDRTFVDCQNGVPAPVSLFAERQLDNKKKSEPLIALSLQFNSTGLIDVPYKTKDKVPVICEIPLFIKYNAEYEARMANFTSSFYIKASVQYMISAKLYNCETAFCEEVSKVAQSINLKTAGKFVTRPGGTVYLFTNKKVTFADSWTECCKWNMIPVVVEHVETLDFLHKNYDRIAMNSSTLFYTSQLDYNFDRRFFSCVSGNSVPREVFLPGEPDNKAQREACIAIQFQDKTSGLVDIRCGEFLNVICESTPNMNEFRAPQEINQQLTTPAVTIKQNSIQTTTKSNLITTNQFTISNIKTIASSDIRKQAYLVGKKNLTNKTLSAQGNNSNSKMIAVNNQIKKINSTIATKINSTKIVKI